MPTYKTVIDTIGQTPLVRLLRVPGAENDARGNIILAKLEGSNPAGSIKDRAALFMITEAEKKGLLKAGDTLIEPTSGNTGIGLAMVGALRGYRVILVMSDDQSLERRQSMMAYGAELVLTPASDGIEGVRDAAARMVAAGKGVMLDQFSNTDNPLAHYRTTGPEIWEQTQGSVTHFVASMGTTGTVIGTGQFLHEKNPAIQVIGCQPDKDSDIPGIKNWSQAYMPMIYRPDVTDWVVDVRAADALAMTRRLAREEGICAGLSSGASVVAALRVAETQRHATIVVIICDRGDRYLSTGIFGE